jgi:ABC-2 type transport system permease protein
MTFRAAYEGALFEILRTRDLVAVAVISVLFYAFYYPAPYAHQVAEHLPIVVVDGARSTLSRAIVRNLAAIDSVTVAADVPDMATAEAMVRARTADGILLLPDGLDDAVAAGRSGGGVALWLNGAYLLRAEAIGTGIGRSIAAVVQDRVAGSARRPPPIAIQAQPLFNTTEGYRDYVFPAVANIILQQTLLFAVARFWAERRRRGAGPVRSAAFAGIWAACATIGTLAAFLYFGLVFWVQDIPRGGNILALLLVVPLFAATVAALALSIGSIMRSGDDALKLLIPTSIPLVFLSGFAWPLAAMPPWVRAAAWAIPSTPATHLFIPLNQMGATLSDVAGALAILAMQMLCFAAIAWHRLTRTTR